MTNDNRKKGLAISVTLLFIGITLAPNINITATKASADHDLVEVTTQACGIREFGDTTVTLTKQQYENLEQYLVEFRIKLNQTSAREEVVPIFEEAVVELNKYGLLPRGMSVEKAQKLILQQDQNDCLTKLQERFHNTRILPESEEKYFSLVAGSTTNTLILGPIPLTCVLTGLIGLILLSSSSNAVQGLIGAALLYSSLYVGLLFYSLPGVLFSVIRIGAQGINADPEVPPEYGPSEGWITSVGLTGKKTWVGPFFGSMAGKGFIGVVGFTGLKIALNINHCFYFGSAMKIGISPNPPSNSN